MALLTTAVGRIMPSLNKLGGIKAKMQQVAFTQMVFMFFIKRVSQLHSNSYLQTVTETNTSVDKEFDCYSDTVGRRHDASACRDGGDLQESSTRR